MKKIIFSLCILLVISSSIISYLTFDFHSKRDIVIQENNYNQIVFLRESNHNNPILVIKND